MNVSRGAVLPLLVLPLILASCSRSEANNDAKLHSTESHADDPATLTATRMLPSVVRIEAIRLRPDQGRMIKTKVGGSGAIISAEGHVITNFHVSQDADFYTCHLADGTIIDATLVGQDALSDIAVLLLRPRPGSAPLPVAKFGDSETVKPGTTVFALGSPASLSSAVTRGIVANPSLVMPENMPMILDGENVGLVVSWILHDASIFPGNSGGPLINERGEIVGINEMGVANLGGAIPGNLAKRVAEELIAKGTVTRGWSGLEVQARLEGDGPAAPGVLVAHVEVDSPAATSGIRTGDVITAVGGTPIEGGAGAMARFTRLEMSGVPGAPLVYSYLRGTADKPVTVPLTLAPREAALSTEQELRPWGAILRDLTRDMASYEQLPDRKGVHLDNIRPGGPAGQAEPELQPGDVIIRVDGKAVANTAELRTLSTELLRDAPGGTRTVLAEVRRDGAIISSVVELRTGNPRSIPPSARKAWLGATNQPLTPKLAARLGIKSEGGARLTRIFAGTQAETAGLRVGDIILAVDGAPVTARRSEDADVFARQLRQYRPGTEASLKVWREGTVTEVPVKLELQPIPAAEMPWWEDVTLEFGVRDIAFDDRIRLQLRAENTGALVESVQAAGWAALAGLRGSDLIIEADGQPITGVADLKASREAARTAAKPFWRLKLLRRGQTLFIETKLQPNP